MNLFIIFSLIIIYKLLKNFYYYRRTLHLQKKYIEWISADGATNFPLYKSECFRLFKSAEVVDRCIPVVQPSGYGNLASFNASIFLNFPSRMASQVEATFSMFDEAVGFYQHRMKETFNPLYWIDLVVFAPKHLLQYLGMDMDKFASKFLNILLSFLWWIFSVFFAVYKEQLKIMIINLCS